MISSLTMQSSTGIYSKPGPSSKHLPFNPILDVSFTRNKISPTRIACNISLGVFGSSQTGPKSGITKRNFVVYSSIEAGNPLPSGPPAGGAWKNWLVGIVVSIILPMLTHKLGPLGLIKDKLFTAIQNVENVVETVEKVAGGVEKMAENVLEELPDGQLKKYVAIVEHIAERAAQDADRIDDIIDKVQEHEEKIEDCLEKVEEKIEEKDELLSKLDAKVEEKIEGKMEVKI